MVGEFFNYERCRQFLEAAVAHYEHSAPPVHRYCNDLYMRLGDGEVVQLAEVMAVQQLFEGGEWEQPNYAANRFYKLMKGLGMDTTGLAGF